jgi:hypothetical protein
MYQLTSLAIQAIAPSVRITANTNGTGVDLSSYTGNALFNLNASAPEGAAQTLDVKLQHSDTVNGTYTDAGIYFDQVTTAGGASLQSKMFSTDGLKKFVRAVGTVGGTSPAVTYGVTITGKKN